MKKPIPAATIYDLRSHKKSAYREVLQSSAFYRVKCNWRVIRLWVVFALELASCAQQSADLRRPADEFAVITECERMMIGEEDAEKRTKWNYIYDTLNRRWLIVDNNTDVTGCLLERHRWVASVLPDGRPAVEAPHQ